MKTRPAPLIVLEALLTGMRPRPYEVPENGSTADFTTSGSVTMDGYEWVLAEGTNGTPVPAIVATLERDGQVMPTLLAQPDFTLSAFLGMCAKLSDDEVFGIGADCALRKMAEEQIHSRDAAATAATV